MKREKTDIKLLWQLFRTVFGLSACTFGDGFVIVSLMKKKVVEDHHWLGEDWTLPLSPSPPPVLFLSTLPLYWATGSTEFDQFRNNAIVAIALMVMRAGVAAVICDVVINLAKNVLASKKALYIALMFTTFIMGYFLGYQRHDNYSELPTDFLRRSFYSDPSRISKR